MQDGAVIEKGGVNFSAVHGKLPPAILSQVLQTPGTGLENKDFFATGVSVVIHPKSPMVPIIHMNVRYFEWSESVRWFGGGIDLTPIYVVEEDARHFHRELKKVCDKHNKDYYPRFRQWADDYFFIPHRNETRGIGGIFFDKLIDPPETVFEFVKDTGEAFAPLYTHFMNKNKNIVYGEKEKRWQFLRRGRYVEFNLVYDKGTKFGLETNGRTESVLMSLPKEVNWLYNYSPPENSPEEKTVSLLKKGVSWV